MDSTHGGILLLPHDVILDIMRRLPLRALAKSRRVCRAWRAAIDDNDNTLLTRFFPPRAFPGVFTSNDDCDVKSSFFAPAPSSRRDIEDEHDFRHPLFDHGWAYVKDHCNGLLLLSEEFAERCYCVCNPATVRCARLPSPPMPSSEVLVGCFWEGVFLAFDPAVSRHHEVFLFPRKITQLRPGMEEAMLSPCVQVQQPQDQLHANNGPAAEEPKDEVLSLLVFSSRTNEWEYREFLPGHCSPEHLCDILLRRENYVQTWKSAQYWRGSLYVHCRKNILTIVRGSQETYDMVQLPGVPLEERTGINGLTTRSVLANYEKGIRYVALDMFQLQVWALNEPADGQLGWTLTHEANLSPYIRHMNHSLLPTKSMVPWKALERKKAKLSLFEPCSDIEPPSDERCAVLQVFFVS
ncbi:unnamed protein product [Alopecurus aequalis]